jgi:hypothetical protein
MSEAVKTDTYFFFLSTHHRQARDKLLGHIKALSGDGGDHTQIAAYCVALITTAGCYVECRINEFWLTALNNGLISPRLTESKKTRFKKIASGSDWKMKKTLEKYQIALDALGVPVFDKGGWPYQDAKTLMSLRNEIVHHVPYETELLNNKRVSKRPKLEVRLQTLIGECPHEGIKDYFPENCFHQACAEWASKTSQMFVDEFLIRSGGNTKVSVSGGIFRI